MDIPTTQNAQETVDEAGAQRAIEAIASKAHSDAGFRTRLESEPHATLQGEGLSDEAIASLVSRLGVEPEVEGHGLGRSTVLAWALAASILSGRTPSDAASARPGDSMPFTGGARESYTQPAPSSPRISGGSGPGAGGPNGASG